MLHVGIKVASAEEKKIYADELSKHLSLNIWKCKKYQSIESTLKETQKRVPQQYFDSSTHQKVLFL